MLRIMNQYALCDLLNDHDLTLIFQKYIYQCFNCGIIVQTGKGLYIPVKCDDGWKYDLLKICFDCNDTIRDKIRPNISFEAFMTRYVDD